MAITFYNEVLTDHNIHPSHKYKMEDATYSLEGVNPSCGDDVVLYIKVDADNVIEDASFDGDGCAISQASADMMCDLIIGKPKDEADAVRMLRALSGREHRVHTGVCICRGRRAAATVETTVVHFSPIAEDDLCAYVRTPEPYDKAGAYAIQGHAALWCAGIEGCYYNIMGLPVHRTAQLLRELT